MSLHKRVLVRKTLPAAVSLLVWMGCAFASPANAQTPANSTAVAAASPGGTADQTADASGSPPVATGDQLQEVVVTAERRATDLQTTAISMVAVSGEQLQTTQITDINSLNQVSANLVIYTTGATSTADIRGVGNSNQGGIEQPGVLIVRDGLPNTEEGAGENQPYYDIADVEVLRGPQGTFTGDNSTGGAIDINSQNPNFSGINGYVDAQVATYSEQRVNGAVNLPVTDTLALRLAFNEETRNSFFYDIYTAVDGPYEAGPYLCNGPAPCLGVTGIGPTYPVSDKTAHDPGNVDNKDVRLGILWKPTNAFQSLTKIELDHEDSNGIPTQPDIYSFSPLAPGLPCPKGEGTAPNCHSIYYPGYSGSPYILNNWASAMLLWDDDVNSFSEQLQYTLPDGIQLRLIGGDQEIADNTVTSTSSDAANVGSYSNGLNQFHVYSGEFDALSPTTGAFSWIAGLSYNYNSEQQASYSVNVNTPYSVTAPAYGFWIDGQNIWEQSHGVFGQISWQFTHDLQLVVGAREGWDSEIALGGMATYRPNGQSPIVNSNQPTNGPVSDRVPSGKVDLNWTPLPGQFFYAFFARGYKPGEENLGVEPTAHYEWVNDYEVGWKGRLADGHVLTQLGGYYMQYYDMIYGIFNKQVPTATSDANIPYSNLKGIEFSMQSQIARFGVNLSAAYNKSTLGPLVNAATYKFPAGVGITPQCAPGVTPNATNSNCTDYTPYLVQLGGESLPYSPDFTANVSLQYSIPLGGMYVVPRVTYAYASKTYSSIFQSDDYYLLPAHGLLGAYLDWTAGPWTTTLYGTNLANTVYLQGTGYYGNPRQLGLEVHRGF